MISARSGFLAGLWVGVLDGALALARAPELASSWLDRAGVLGLAMLCDGAVGAALGAALSLFISRWLTGQRGAPRPSIRVAALLGIASIAVAVTIAAVGSPTGSRGSDPRPNLILLSIDTLRADHLSVYGYPRDTSPHLAEFARGSVTFERAYANSPWTLPSHASIFTGLDPFAHGALSRDSRLSSLHATIAEQLRDAGYRTGAFVGARDSDFVGARRGLDQGFGFYRHVPYPARFALAFIPHQLDMHRRAIFDRWLGRAGLQVDTALRWLRSPKDEPFFLFLHFWDVHSRFGRYAYEAPEPFFDQFCPGELDGYTGCRGDLCASYRLLEAAEGDEPLPGPVELEKIRCLYDGTIAYVDHELGRLFDGIDALGLDERTVIVVTSDHGESFLEHGAPLHFTLHDEVLRVPLVIRLPGGAAGKRAAGNVELVDLAPTLLELAGLDAAPHIQGQSLVTVLRDWPTERDAEVLAVDHGVHSTSLHSGRHKFIDNPDERNMVLSTPHELYDLASDSNEQNNQATARPALADELRRRLESRRAASEALFREIVGAEVAPPVELDADERARLRALGYEIDDPDVESDSRPQ